VQGERTADRREGGLGIGLALVKSLVELHGGTVQCASGGLGFGTTFTVCLPLHQVAEAKAAPLDSRDAAVAADARLEPVAHRRILIVDDNVDAADTLAMLLEDAGHRTWVENHPSAALTRAAEVAPDTCLLDVGLPDIDGYELAQRLRQLPQLSQSLLIAVTGYGQANDRQRAKHAGFDHFFVKPLDIQALTEVLADAS
jgi:CheY-like chemotaxis protein